MADSDTEARRVAATVCVGTPCVGTPVEGEVPVRTWGRVKVQNSCVQTLLDSSWKG
jgi:hypothetical protein